MSSPSLDAQEELKKNYLSSLNWMLIEVDKLIYLYNAPIINTLEPMQGIIDVLQPTSKEQLQGVYDEIEKYLNNTKLVRNRKQIKNLYRKISDFLLTHELKEAGVKPRISSSPALGDNL